MLLVEESKPHNRESCEQDIVHLVEPLFVNTLTSKAWLETIPELRKDEDHILVENVAH